MPDTLDLEVIFRGERVPPDSLRIDGGTQPRAEIDEKTIEEYREWLEANPDEDMPAVGVIRDAEGNRWLFDGFHRLEAYRRAGRMEIPIRFGRSDLREARRRAAGANIDHGLRRTNEDKRRAVALLLGDPEWARWSDSEIGRHCGVTHSLVSKVRGEMREAKARSKSSSPDSESSKGDGGKRTYKHRSGRTTTIDTKPISKANKQRGQPPEPEETPLYESESQLEALKRLWAMATKADRAEFLTWVGKGQP